MDKEESLFLERLYANTFYSGRPALRALGDTLSEFRSSKSRFAAAFNGISRRIRLGEDAGIAFKNEIGALRIKDSSLVSRMADACNGNDVRLLVENICREFSHAERVRLETGFGALQKYLAIAMLVSTILPSLALFGFVGYSILYGSQSIFIAFSLLLLSVFPALFMAAKRRISGVYGQE